MTLGELTNWSRSDYPYPDPVDCNNGWVYDRTEFKETVMSEVSISVVDLKFVRKTLNVSIQYTQSMLINM